MKKLLNPELKSR